MRSQYLTHRDHDRDAAGLTYVYPVISRRAGGVSIGINLNPDNACNWRCVYCQVPNLRRGSAPQIDLPLLERELAGFLQQVLHGDYMREHVPPECRTLCDIAISGNGEPTSSRQFEQVVELVIGQMRRFEIVKRVKLRLITNGSYMQKPHVQAALGRMGEIDGEVWFKVDAADAEAVARINGVRFGVEQVRQRLSIAAGCCPTWIQSCVFAWKGEVPQEAEICRYLDLLTDLKRDGVDVKGVLLYGPARTPMLAEGADVSPLPEAWMRQLAARIEGCGYAVRLTL